MDIRRRTRTRTKTRRGHMGKKRGRKVMEEGRYRKGKREREKNSKCKQWRRMNKRKGKNWNTK